MKSDWMQDKTMLLRVGVYRDVLEDTNASVEYAVCDGTTESERHNII